MTLGENFNTPDIGQHPSPEQAQRPQRCQIGWVNQRSFNFADPDGNTLEIYYELLYALELFAGGRAERRSTEGQWTP
ncbi:MAG: hypothetical protein JO358_12020 [Alphaproteobacteria bacterium]|nr:hypothetical protein [Alphaproteobacteria bacterium]